MIPKFKAWLKNEKKLVDVSSIDFRIEEIAYEEHCTLANIQQSWYEFRGFNDIELLPCINLKDKNGVEIYEGDIVKIQTKGFDNKIITRNGIVKFFKEKACFGIDLKDMKINLYEDCTYLYKVIGNIYENPELLGGTYDR